MEEEKLNNLIYLLRIHHIDSEPLENLIKGYKELESELQHRNDQLFLGDTQWEKYIDRNYIPKSKVRVLIEKYRAFGWHNKDDEYWANRILDGFEKLLQKGDK